MWHRIKLEAKGDMIMKQQIIAKPFFSTFLIILMITLGCGGGGSNGVNPPANLNPNAQAYFPLNVGDSMTYIIMKGPDNAEVWGTTAPHTYTVRQVQLALQERPIETAYYLELTPITDVEAGADPIVMGPLCKGTSIIGLTTDIGDDDLCDSYAQLTSSDITIIPNPTPDIGDSWLLAAVFGDWMPGYDLPFNIDALLSISATATLASVEDITIQEHVYKNALKINVTGDINSAYWSIPLVGLGSYWLVENVGLVAMEAKCDGWITDSVRIERVP